MMTDVILLFSAALLFLALVMYLDVRTSGGPASLQLEAMAHKMVPPPPETKNKETMNINIDKFELMYLLEGCSIGSHLRQGIWERCIDEFYDKLSRDERLWLYTYAKRDITPRYKREDAVGREDFFKFLACFNPANRYMVAVEGEVDGKHKRELVDAYKYGDVFWVSYRRYIPEEYIKSVERDRVSPCSASYCMWHDSCYRYSTDPNVADRLVSYADTKCDWYINEATEHGADYELTEQERANITAGYMQLEEKWMDNESIYGSRIKAAEDHAEFFRTKGEMKKRIKHYAEMRNLMDEEG